MLRAAFTNRPLRAVSAVGVLPAVVAFPYGACLAAGCRLDGHEVGGWTTTVVSLMPFSGIQPISPGVVGESVGRVFEQVEARPPSVVRRESGRGSKSAPS